MSKQIRDFLVANKALFGRDKCPDIGKMAIKFCSENGIPLSREIVMEFGIEAHAVRALDLV